MPIKGNVFEKKKERGKTRLYFPIISPVPVTDVPPLRTAEPRSAITAERWGFMLPLNASRQKSLRQNSAFVRERLHRSSTLTEASGWDR